VSIVTTGTKVADPVVPAVATPLARSITGVTPPVEVTRPAVPETLVTEPVPLLLNVVQSAALNAPRLVADAVGRLSVITGVVVELATVEETSVPVVPSVNADTLVTVPPDTTKTPGTDQVNVAVDLELTNAIETHTLLVGAAGGVLDQPAGGVPTLVTKLHEPPVGVAGVDAESRKIKYSK
jgi:hypothetical protein